MQPLSEARALLTRRQLFGRGATLAGTAALASLLNSPAIAAPQAPVIGGLAGVPHFAPKAKRVIYLFQSGGPSQLELFDDKPLVRDKHAAVPADVADAALVRSL